MRSPERVIPAKNKIDVGINVAHDYWHDWIDKAPIEDYISNPTGDDTLIYDTARDIRKLLKGDK